MSRLEQKIAQNNVQSTSQSTTNIQPAKTQSRLEQRVTQTVQPTQQTVQPIQPTFNTLEEAQNYAKSNNLNVSSNISTPTIKGLENTQISGLNTSPTNLDKIDTSVYERGNPITQSILKIENFAKNNNINIPKGYDNDYVNNYLTEQSKNLSEDKQKELEKYIYTYNTVKEEDLKKSNYIGKKAISGAVSSLSGLIDAGIGLTRKRENPAIKSANEFVANQTDKIEAYNKYKDNYKSGNITKKELFDKINEYANQGIAEREEINQKKKEEENAKTRNALNVNILGTTSDQLKNDVAKMEEIQNVSDFKKFTGNVVSGITGMTPTILVSTMTQNPELALKMMSTSAGGNAYREAIQEGGSNEEALAYGTLMGIKEYTTEKMFGALNKMAGFDVKGYGDEFFDSLINKVFEGSGNQILQGFANFAVGGLGEGLEEFVGSIVEPYIKNLTMGTNEKANVKEALYEGFVGAITGMVMGAPRCNN